MEHAHVLIEYAAGQLERAGIVSFTTLPEKLIDDENDYLITLTEKGRHRLAEGGKFGFYDMDL